MKLSLTLVPLAVMPFLLDWQTNSGADVKRIPLDSVYTSGAQKGTKSPVEDNIVQVPDSPVIFMINGSDFPVALAVSTQNFKLSRDTKSSKYPTEIKGSENQWVVAYMGSNGSGPVYIVKSIEIENKKVRVSFEFLGGSVLLDLREYIVWVPVEKLPPDEYQLELYDVGAKKVVATGKCKVVKN